MREFATKVDNVGDTLSAGGFNAYIEELENICISADFTLDPEGGPDFDKNMLGKTACAYGSASSVLADSGSANAYALGRVASSNLKTTDKYYDGQFFVFEAGNTNSGASTANAFTIGAKNIFLRGVALTGAEIKAGEQIIIIYDQANDRFNLLPTGEATETVGFVKTWPTESAPGGYLECDGSAIARTTYADLFGAIGTRYGVGDGSTTFNLPDYRGEFSRGWDHTAGTDPDAGTRTDRGDGVTGDNIGTKQAWQNESHLHTQTVGSGASASVTGLFAGAVGPVLGTNDSSSAGGNQANPTNVNVMRVIKF